MPLPGRPVAPPAAHARYWRFDQFCDAKLWLDGVDGEQQRGLCGAGGAGDRRRRADRPRRRPARADRHPRRRRARAARRLRRDRRAPAGHRAAQAAREDRPGGARTSSSSARSPTPAATRAAGSRRSPTSPPSRPPRVVPDPSAHWIPARGDTPLAFDHREVLDAAVERLEGKLWWSNITVGMLPGAVHAQRGAPRLRGDRPDALRPGDVRPRPQGDRPDRADRRAAGDGPGPPRRDVPLHVHRPGWGAGRRKRIAAA